jgi:hypothetical protein
MAEKLMDAATVGAKSAKSPSRVPSTLPTTVGFSSDSRWVVVHLFCY